MRYLRLFTFLLAGSAGTALAQTQGLACPALADPVVVHAEGVAERLGEIVLRCSGANPGAVLNLNFALFLNTTVTNKLASDGTTDVRLDIETASGAVLPTIFGRLAGNNQVVFSGVAFTVPSTDPTGLLNFRFNNLRGDMTRLPLAPSGAALVVMSVTGTTQLAIDRTTLTVGVPLASVFGTFVSTVSCSQLGSPLPASLTLSSLLQAGTSFASTRITEGFATAFHPREAGADNGVRIMSRYGGFPSGARIFVPDVIAGSTADVPTSAGDFGVAASGGQYTAGQNSLLLVRVRDTDANGAGGTLPSTATLGSFSEVTLTGGTGIAVYEVVDANPTARETFQIPTFLGLAASGVAANITTTQDIVLAPISTVSTASATAPVPRFNGGLAGADCGIVGDCDASYLPKLSVFPEPLTYTVVQGSFDVRYIRVLNEGSGVLPWTNSVEYKTGSGWLRVTPSTGFNNYTFRADAMADNLAPGTYEATLVVDGGIAGRKTFPVTMVVTARTTPATPATPDSGSTNPKQPVIKEAVNAVTGMKCSFVSGSLAVVRGTFAGKQRSLSVDGLPATVLEQDGNYVKFQVPKEVAGAGTARVVVTVDGVDSAPFPIDLAAAAPTILDYGVLNEDYSANGSDNPAAAGTRIQIFATGLLSPNGGTVSVLFNDREITALDYAGPHDDLVGIQRVDVHVPTDLGTTTADVRVCNTSGAERACSDPVKLTIRKR